MQLEQYTLGDLARYFERELGVSLPVWKIRRLYERRLLPEPGRIGNYRVVDASDVPAIEDALKRCGYLPDDVEGAHGR